MENMFCNTCACKVCDEKIREDCGRCNTCRQIPMMKCSVEKPAEADASKNCVNCECRVCDNRENCGRCSEDCTTPLAKCYVNMYENFYG